MSGGASNDAAMSLWQKFSDLQSQAQKHRSRRVAKESKSSQLRAEIEQCRLDRRVEEESIDLMEEKIGKYVSLLGRGAKNNEPRGLSIQDQLNQAEKAHQDAVDKLSSSERAQEQWNDWKQDQLLAEYERSQCWRQKVQELRLQSDALGLPPTFSFSSLDPGLELNELSELETDVNVNENEEDPLSWVIPESDTELRQAVASFASQRTKYLAASADLEEWKGKFRAQESKCDSKEQRASGLREKIKKVNSDSDDLELQIDQLERNLAGSGMAMIPNNAQYNRNGRAGVTRNQPATNSVPIYNPYAPQSKVPVHNPYGRPPAPPMATNPVPMQNPPYARPATNPVPVQNLYWRPPASRTPAPPMDSQPMNRRLIPEDRQFGQSVGLRALAPNTNTQVIELVDDSTDEEEDELLHGDIGLSKRHKSA